MASIYKLDYEGIGEMQSHDRCDELRRWFDNYKLERGMGFAQEHEWLTIEEKRFTANRRKCVVYTGTIGRPDDPSFKLTIHFETNAPPPPTFFRAAPKPARRAPAPKTTRYDGGAYTTLDQIHEALRRIGMPPERRVKLAYESRTFWEFAEKAHLAVLKHDAEKLKLHTPHAINWLLPMGVSLYPQNSVVIADEGMRTVPPPRRHRRN